MTNWPLVTLASLCRNAKADIVDGPFGSNLKREDYITSGIPVLKIQNIKESGVILKKMDYVTPEKFTELSRHSFRRGDIVITKLGDPLGIAAVVDEIDEGLIVADLVRIRVDESRVDTRYLAYAINSTVVRTWLNDQQKGSTRPRVSLLLVRAMPIPLPPLDEQKRIVAMLDQVFAEIESAEEVVTREISAVQVFAKGLLNDLLSRAGDVRVFTLAKLMQDGLVCDHMDGNHGGNYPRKSEFIGSGVPYISAKAIVDGEVDLSAAKYLSPKRAALLRKGLAKHGDVLFAHNATVGPVAVLRTEDPFVVLGTSLTYYRCDSSRLWPDFLAHYMRSLAFVRQYQNVMGQSTRNQVPITTQRRFTFSIPSLPIQKRIASTMNAALSESSQLLTSFESKLALFRELRSSAMTQALRERS